MTDIERQRKVLSMMITGHSVLRDRYLFWSASFDISLIVASAILNVIVFVDENYIFTRTGLEPDSQKIIGGLASVIVFAISIVLLRVRWKEKAEDHSKAAEQLFNLMQESRRISTLHEGRTKDEAIEKFNDRYTQVFSTIIKLPEGKFNSLKMIHYRKVELSKLIERYPKSRLFILKIRLFLSSFKENKP